MNMHQCDKPAGAGDAPPEAGCRGRASGRWGFSEAMIIGTCAHRRVLAHAGRGRPTRRVARRQHRRGWCGGQPSRRGRRGGWREVAPNRREVAAHRRELAAQPAQPLHRLTLPSQLLTSITAAASARKSRVSVKQCDSSRPETSHQGRHVIVTLLQNSHFCSLRSREGFRY